MHVKLFKQNLKSKFKRKPTEPVFRTNNANEWPIDLTLRLSTLDTVQFMRSILRRDNNLKVLDKR